MKRILILLPFLFFSCQYYFGTAGEFGNFQVQKSGNELLFSWDQPDYTEYKKEWQLTAQKAEEQQDVTFRILSGDGESVFHRQTGKETSVTVSSDTLTSGEYVACIRYAYLSGYMPSSVRYESRLRFTLDEKKEIVSVNPEE